MTVRVAVRGTFIKPNGKPAAGQVSFTPRVQTILNSNADTITVQAVSADLDGSGHFTVNLQATDDPDINPSGWTYLVQEAVYGGGEGRSYDIFVPASAVGTGIDLVSLAPVSPAGGGSPTGPSSGAFNALSLQVATNTTGIAANATAIAVETAARSAVDLDIQQRVKTMLALSASTPNALLRQMSFGPSITNTGPNAAATVTNPILYPVWVLAPDNVTQIPNPTPPWTRRGFANEWPILISPGVNGGPYLVHQRPTDNVADLGPGWYEFWSDAPDIEIDYLSSVAGQLRVYSEDTLGPNGVGLAAVTSGPEVLISTGGALYRRRYSFGLGTPGTPTGVQAAGGTLANGLYGYRVTAFDSRFAETQATAQFTITTTGSNGTVNLSWTAATNTAAGNQDRTINSYNIYRTAVGGAGTEKLIGNTATLAFSDTGLAGGATLTRIFSSQSSRRMRRILLETYLAEFGGITLNKADTIYPAIPATSRVLFIGDSLTQGVGANNSTFSYAAQAAQRLGFQDPDVYGILGSGYIVSGGVTTFIQRLPGVAYTPDLIITAGGRNDVGQTSGAITTAVAAYLAAVKAKWPNTPHTVLSPWYTADADVTTVGTAVAAACAAATPPVPYIDLLAAKIIVGTGTAGLPTGDGNADWVMASDRIHWTLLGHELVSEAVAAAIEGRLSALTF